MFKRLSFPLGALALILFGLLLYITQENNKIHQLNPALDSLKIQLANIAKGDLIVKQSGYMSCVRRNNGVGGIDVSSIDGHKTTIFDTQINEIKEIIIMSDPRYPTEIRKFVLQ